MIFMKDFNQTFQTIDLNGVEYMYSFKGMINGEIVYNQEVFEWLRELYDFLKKEKVVFPKELLIDIYYTILDFSYSCKLVSLEAIYYDTVDYSLDLGYIHFICEYYVDAFNNINTKILNII